MCQSMRQIQPGTGGSLVMFQNTNKKLFVLCAIFLPYCTLKGIKVKKFGDELKKCRPMRQIFLNEL